MRLFFALFLAVFAFAVPAPAQAIEDPAAVAAAFEKARGQERILSYSSDIAIARNGELDVTETIRVVSLADQIKRGIFRDFPTSYDNRYGQTTRVTFDVVSVMRDGKTEDYVLEDADNGVRVRIGNADRLLPPGEHVYVIRYKTTRQLVYLDDRDEIYWNVTGNGWAFPIDMAEVRITLPTDAMFGDRAVYTGPFGSTAQDAAVVQERRGFIHFRTTAPLERYSGLTIAAAFPKGVLIPPSERQKLRWWIEDWGALVAALAALAALFVYFFYAWLRAGKGPRKGTIVPIFSPPDDLSAAACRYINRMKADNRGFTAAIVDLAVRGHVGITKEEGGWFGLSSKTTLDRREGGRPAPQPEMAMCNSLLPGIGSQIELKQDNHGKLQSARSLLNDGLEKAYSGKLFVKNSGWAVVGLLAIAAAMLFVAVIAIFAAPGTRHPDVVRVPFIGLLALIVIWLLHKISQGASVLVKIGVWILIGIAIVVAFFTTVATIGLAVEGGGWAVFVPLLALPLAFTAFAWMYAPTVEGRAVMDRIAGFRQYLGITEEERLEALHPPEKTPELFERYLPYAIALDVENRWADKFATVLAAAAVAGAAAHTAGWYSGDGDFWNDPDGFARSVGSSLDSTIASASSSPSSGGGGSSGGGSSGGGGGGGGGGGW